MYAMVEERIRGRPHAQVAGAFVAPAYPESRETERRMLTSAWLRYYP